MSEAKEGVSGYILIKLASRCNLDCHYCYWFRDKSVYEKPKLIEDTVIDSFLSKLAQHILENRIPVFQCIFHGGEPLLYPKAKFIVLLDLLVKLSETTGCKILFSLSTNGVLIDDEWCAIFKQYDVRIAVSIDGPKEVHDRNRPYLSGRGSYEHAVRGYDRLRNNLLIPSILAVCDPTSDPVQTMKHFVEDLNVKYCDVLVPDNTFEDQVLSISQYYVGLFDFWYDNYLDRGIEVRFLSGLIRAVLGLAPNSDSFGYAPTHTISLLTDGSLEPLDVLRIAGYQSTKTEYNIATHRISDVRDDPKWRAAYESSVKLCETCEQCQYKYACGGGHLSQRWSKVNGYDNPSVYCQDFKVILDHVIERVSRDVSLSEIS